MLYRGDNNAKIYILGWNINICQGRKATDISWHISQPLQVMLVKYLILIRLYHYLCQVMNWEEGAGILGTFPLIEAREADTTATVTLQNDQHHLIRQNPDLFQGSYTISPQKIQDFTMTFNYSLYFPGPYFTNRQQIFIQTMCLWLCIGLWHQGK